MKNQILEMLVDFADKIDNNTSVFSGSIYTKSDVVELLSELANSIRALEEPVVPSRIDDAVITRLVEIAESSAIEYARNCADNYEFDDIQFDTSEYRGELTVTGYAEVDSNSLSLSATFRKDAVKTMITELLTPNAQPNA